MKLRFISKVRFTIQKATFMSDFAKASDLFGINKFEEFHVDVFKMLGLYLNTLIIGHRSWNILSILNKLKL